MDVFSLEEDDGSSLFITQGVSKVQEETYNFDVGGDLMDLGGESLSQDPENYAHTLQVEDISDDDFQFPSSQMAFNQNVVR